MALVSPGLEITVTDEAQYLSAAIGTVPLIFLATEQDKIFNGSVAQYTTKDNANKLMAFTSQRELITGLGYPVFKQSAAGTPLHGNEQNEYGLMTGYSALGACNRAYVIRADIDLAELEGTSVRPIGEPADETFWLDIGTTTYGIYQWSASSQSFTNKVPDVITDAANLTGGVPKDSYGTIGSYAIVATTTDNALYYKRSDNTWALVGSVNWQVAHPTIQGTVANPTLTNGHTVSINTTIVTLAGTTVAALAANINSATIQGVTAAAVGGKLEIYADSTSQSDGAVTDGKIAIANGTGTILTGTGITAGTYARPVVEFSSYVDIPDWRSSDSTPRPTGSIWVKTSAVGSGASFVVKQYNADSDSWTTLAAPLYSNDVTAIYGLDPVNGGFNISADSVYIKYDVDENTTVKFQPRVRKTSGATTITGTSTSISVVNGETFTLTTSETGSDTTTTYTCTLAGTDGAAFVAAILAANIPEVTATLNASGSVTIKHLQGGYIAFAEGTGTPLADAGFDANTTGMQALNDGTLYVSNFDELTYTYSDEAPYVAPADGALWYYNDPLSVDILINNNGWKGYKTVSNDARGYDLTATDPAGPILAATEPTTQSDDTALVDGDLWIDTSDLENFPVIRRYDAGTGDWTLIDNADVTTQNGILFADARWDTDGTTDPAAGDFTEITDLLASNYIDIDCPDYRLYPRGTLLFNTRRSGYNIKRYVSNYFNATSFPDDTLPTEKDAWVSASGLKNDGSPYMGRQAQRNMVVSALKAAIDGNEAVREEQFAFSLMVAPGYPECIPNMVALNNDRKNTAFIIGDTPMTLAPSTTDIVAWSNNSNGDGLSTSDPYLGVFYPAGITNDLQGEEILMPSSHMALRAAIRSDNASYPWFAFAGTRRGTVDNATDLGYLDLSTGEFVRNGVNNGLRDSLYENKINPISIIPGIGICIWGQKTRYGSAGALDRINVARLVVYIRTMLARAGDGFLFEQNDKILRDQFKRVVETAFNDLIAKRAISDVVVWCDETNNTPVRVARNELYLDAAIVPIKSAEFIYIPLRLRNEGDI